MARRRRKIYAIYDNGVLLGHYTSKEASDLIGIPCATVSAYAASGARYKRRYTMEVVGVCDTDASVWRAAWSEEWDRVRTEKLAWLRGGGTVGHQNYQETAGRVPGDKTKADHSTS